jgi:hypothetical protein
MAYFLVSATFHYLGPAFAVLLFEQVDVLGVAWLRIASAALVFGLWRRPWRLLGPPRPALLAFGCVLAAMNACFYLAIARLPLGTVGAIEFLGTLVLAAVGVRTPRNFEHVPRPPVVSVVRAIESSIEWGCARGHARAGGLSPSLGVGCETTPRGVFGSWFVMETVTIERSGEPSRPEVPAQTNIVGDPAAEIVATAELHDAAAVVMATHGRRSAAPIGCASLRVGVGIMVAHNPP